MHDFWNTINLFIARQSKSLKNIFVKSMFKNSFPFFITQNRNSSVDVVIDDVYVAVVVVRKQEHSLAFKRILSEKLISLQSNLGSSIMISSMMETSSERFTFNFVVTLGNYILVQFNLRNIFILTVKNIYTEQIVLVIRSLTILCRF